MFGITGVDPHVAPTPVFAVVSIAYGIGFAALGGWVAVALSRRHDERPTAIVGVVIAVIAAVSLATQVGRGSAWSEVATLLLMAPAAALGVRLRLKRARASRE